MAGNFSVSFLFAAQWWFAKWIMVFSNFSPRFDSIFLTFSFILLFYIFEEWVYVGFKIGDRLLLTDQ